MKKIYICLLSSFLFVSGAFASNQTDWYGLRRKYDSFKPDITDEMMVAAAITRKKDPSDESALHFCIASYICSDDEVRGMLEDDLGKDDRAIKIAKEILSKTGK